MLKSKRSAPARSLTTYRQKRHFGRTSEPRGQKGHGGAGFSFVVQKHAARRLHYDFRLELDGVLLSWAVPKGPSMDPGVKRMAVQTEDHPIEYGSFEGVIPKGEYGGGSVVVWDRGRWVPDGDPRANYERGRLTFRLEGEKLKGSFHLVRTKANGNGKPPSWLLIKRNDDDAQRGSGAKLVEDAPRSVLSGRTVEEVASDRDRVWHSRERTGEWPDPRVKGAHKAELPEVVEPELATLVAEPPRGDDWLHEIKLDGYRMLARCDSEGDVRWLTRRGHDWSARLPTLSAELRALQLPDALIDGELVVQERGLSSFQQLQNSLNDRHDGRVIYYAFDLIHFAGHDLRGAALVERKRLLAEMLAAAGAGQESRVRLSAHVRGQGEQFFAHACELGVEGSVCKRADSRYTSGRGRSWVKVKCLQRQEFVIGGFTEPSGARSHFGALLLGVQGDGGLEYAGRVGTGFSQRSIAELYARLIDLERAKPAFVAPPRGANARGVHWVEPRLVAEISFTERTGDGMLRHPVFLGLREDKAAAQVHDERAVPAQTQPLPALRSARLTHPDRVLYPEQGLTKADLALYYAQVAPRMLPHVGERPLMIVRCPEGHGAQCFHQKHPGKGMSKAVKRVKIAESKGVLESMYVDDAEGLVQLVQMGALEIHTWGSHSGDVEHPDQLTFDLDPDEGLPWPEVAGAARDLKRRLERLELRSFLKLTGGKGLHLVVPIAPSLEWDDAKQFCKTVAERMMRGAPDKYVITISKQKRKGKLLIDYLRNGRGATAVCAYSTRARAGAPVALPIAWSELNAKSPPGPFSLREVPARIASTPDPWADFGQQRAKLTQRVLRAASEG